uniref:G_PROTEIN_RECEP_F1_2 domain-containing protein n=1 Tax=Parastrongyloides trichosuri TaxID=131310 RepID=A0A0N4ZU78_PARTI
MSNVTEDTSPLRLVSDSMIYGTLFVSILGFIGNFLILLITVRTKFLRNRCNYLIGFLAFSDLIICLYLIQLRIFMLHGVYMMKNTFCFYTSLYGLIFLNNQAGLGLIVGLDRLIAVKYPFFYNRIEDKTYFVTIFIILISYSIVITGIGYYYSSENVITPVCMPPTAYNGPSRMIWIISNMIIVIIVILIFFITWNALRQSIKGMASNVDKNNLNQIHRVLSSLTIIIAVYSSTWALTVLSLLVTQVFAQGTPLAKSFEQQLAWLVIINASTNFPIYIWRTKDYRVAFIAMICFKKENSISKSIVIGYKNRFTTSS